MPQPDYAAAGRARKAATDAASLLGEVEKELRQLRDAITRGHAALSVCDRIQQIAADHYAEAGEMLDQTGRDQAATVGLVDDVGRAGADVVAASWPVEYDPNELRSAAQPTGIWTPIDPGRRLPDLAPPSVDLAAGELKTSEDYTSSWDRIAEAEAFFEERLNAAMKSAERARATIEQASSTEPKHRTNTRTGRRPKVKE